MVQMTNCPQCGYSLTSHTQGDFCANCHWPAATWATDKIAALAAERDELKRANEEMAARLRAARNAWGYGNDYLGDGDIKLEWPRSDELTDALNGPVPECPGCAERDAAIVAASDMAESGAQIMGCETCVEVVCILARHDEGEG